MEAATAFQTKGGASPITGGSAMVHLEAHRLALDAKILVSVTFHYVGARLAFLEEVLRELSQFGVAQLDVIVITNTHQPGEIDTLSELCNQFSSEQKCFSAYVNTSIMTHPFLLTWCHKKLIREVFLASPNTYTHFVYLEDDIRFSCNNFEYFCAFREPLEGYGLIPSFVRVERSEALGCYVSTDNTQPASLVDRRKVLIQPYEFINLPSSYNGMFVLDRELAAEYVQSRSFDADDSVAMSSWSIRERAAMGLTFEAVPDGFAARCVVPVSTGDHLIPSCSFVYHLPNNYAEDPMTPFGKLPIAQMIAVGSEERSGAPSAENLSDALEMIRRAPLEELASPEWVKSTSYRHLGLRPLHRLICRHFCIVTVGAGCARFNHPISSRNTFASLAVRG